MFVCLFVSEENKDMPLRGQLEPLRHEDKGEKVPGATRKDWNNVHVSALLSFFFFAPFVSTVLYHHHAPFRLLHLTVHLASQY